MIAAVWLFGFFAIFLLIVHPLSILFFYTLYKANGGKKNIVQYFKKMI